MGTTPEGDARGNEYKPLGYLNTWVLLLALFTQPLAHHVLALLVFTRSIRFLVLRAYRDAMAILRFIQQDRL
jgi:hypothetical protein